MTTGRINQVCTYRHQVRTRAQTQRRTRARPGAIQHRQRKQTVVRTKPPILLFDFRAHKPTLETERSHMLESMPKHFGPPSGARDVRSNSFTCWYRMNQRVSTPTWFCLRCQWITRHHLLNANTLSVCIQAGRRLTTDGLLPPLRFDLFGWLGAWRWLAVVGRASQGRPEPAFNIGVGRPAGQSQPGPARASLHSPNPPGKGEGGGRAWCKFVCNMGPNRRKPLTFNCKSNGFWKTIKNNLKNK